MICLSNLDGKIITPSLIVVGEFHDSCISAGYSVMMNNLEYTLLLHSLRPQSFFLGTISFKFWL